MEYPKESNMQTKRPAYLIILLAFPIVRWCILFGKERVITFFKSTALLYACVFLSCGLLDGTENFDKPELPDDSILYTTVFGKAEGVWTFDPTSFEVKDTIATGSTWSIVLSKDQNTLYAGSRDPESDSRKIVEIDLQSNEIIRHKELRNSNIEANWNQTKLISMGTGIEVLDAHTFETLYEGQDSILNATAQIVASSTKDEFYALVYIEEQDGLGLMVFDTETYEVNAIIPLAEDENQGQSMQGAYIDISPDGKYIYATTFTWAGGGGYGNFHVIDVEQGKQIFKSACAAFAWIGVSPDGRYVYLSDPAGTPFFTSGFSYELRSTDQILRYDTIKKVLRVFIDGSKDIGLTGRNALVTTSLAVAPDGKSMFIRVLDSGFTENETIPALIHLDTRTKKILNTYTQVRDPDGFIRSWMHQLKLRYIPDSHKP